MNPGTLTGNTGIPGPTLADFSAKVNKSTTTLLALIMMPTVGLHTGVTGTDENGRAHRLYSSHPVVSYADLCLKKKPFSRLIPHTTTAYKV